MLPLALCNDKIAVAGTHLRNNLRPIRRQRPTHLKRCIYFRLHRIFAVGGKGHAHERDGRSLFAELDREPYGVAYNVCAARGAPGPSDNALLQINQH